MAVSVLMLQAFARQRRSSRRASDEEATAAHVGRRPDQVANPLQSKHRVINKEWNRIDAVIGIRRTGGDERTHRSRFRDPFLQNLPVLSLLVIKERIHIDRLIQLPDTRIDADLPEQRLHPERSRLIRNHRHDKAPHFRVAQQLRQHAHEHHRGRSFAPFGAFVEFFKQRFRNRLQRRGAHPPHRHVTAQLLAAFLHVFDFRTVVGRPIKRSIVQLAIRNRNTKPRAENLQLIVVQLFLLVRDVLAFARFAESVALDGLGQNDRRRPRMIDRGPVSRMNLNRIVTAQPHARQLLVRKMLHHLE